MKHARDDYNRIQDPAGLIPADEPVFLIRATDPLAYKMVTEYAERCMAAGCDDTHVADALDHARRVFAWQQAFPDLVKKKPD